MFGVHKMDHNNDGETLFVSTVEIAVGKHGLDSDGSPILTGGLHEVGVSRFLSSDARVNDGS
jgi:hypothetical protein